jgi:hypothetical protein
MNATLWLIAGLIALLLMCGFALFMGRFIANRWNEADARLQATQTPPCRTADRAAMERDLRKLRQRANQKLQPSYPRPAAPPAQPKVKP